MTQQLSSDTDSALALFQALGHFEILSRLRVNSSKAEGLWICLLKKNYSKPLGIKWPNEPIEALGVFFTSDNTLLCEKHFRETIVNVKKDMNIGSSRGLSICGKIVIIKSVLLSKLMYIASLLPTPTYIIKEAIVQVFMKGYVSIK